MTDPETIEAVAAALAPQQLLIADGHHRYETALAYHAEQGTPESGFMMVVLVGEEQDGLTIFPTHRLGEVQANLLGGGPSDPKEALAWVEALPRDRAEVAVYTRRRSTRRHRRGGRARRRARRAARDRPGLRTRRPPTRRSRRSTAATPQAAFLLRPASLEQVWALAEAGQVMPQKSTYFYPKLLSGLLFHPV